MDIELVAEETDIFPSAEQRRHYKIKGDTNIITTCRLNSAMWSIVWNKDVWINQRINLNSEFIDNAI